MWRRATVDLVVYPPINSPVYIAFEQRAAKTDGVLLTGVETGWQQQQVRRMMTSHHYALAADTGGDNGPQSWPGTSHMAEIQQKHGEEQGGHLDEEFKNQPLLDSMRSEQRGLTLHCREW